VVITVVGVILLLAGVGVVAGQSNTAPSADTASPNQETTITPGESVTFTLSASDPDGNLHGAEWYVDEAHQGNTYGVEGSESTDSNSFSFDSPGTYTVEAVVFDWDSAYSNSVEWTVTVESDNEPPSVAEESPGSSVSVSPDESVRFSIDATDPDGNLHGAEWYIDDEHQGNTYGLSGSSSTDSNSFSFDSPGTYTVEAKAYDQENAYSDNAAEWTVTVESGNDAPSISREDPGYDVSATPGESMTFTISGSDSDGNLQGVEWYVDDEHEDNTYGLSGSSGTDATSFSFDSAGTYTVEAKAFDNEDAYSEEAATWSVTVDSDNQPPSVTRENPGNDVSATPDESMTFTISGSDSDGNLQGVEWYVDDEHEDNTYGLSGSSGTDSKFLSFDSAGTYTVEAKAFDNENAYSEDAVTWTVTVESGNEAPIVSRDSSDETVITSPGESVSLTVDGSDANGNLQGVEWYVDDEHMGNTYDLSGSSGSDSKSFDFDSTGTYTVEAKAFDQQDAYSDGEATWTVEVTKTNRAPTAARESPSASITVAPGNSVSFTVAGSDADGNLGGTEWYIDDEYQETTRELSGDFDTNSNSFSFDSVGTYSVEATVFDSNEAYTEQSASWEVTVEQTDAEVSIEDVTFQEGTFHPGETLTATGTLVNDGETTTTVTAEYSHVGPAGDRVSGASGASTTTELAPDERTDVELQWVAPDDPNIGQYTAELVVTASNSESVHDRESVPNTIKLEPTVDGAELLSVDQDEGTFEPGDSVKVDFNLKNHDEEQSSYYVEYSPRGPNGTLYDQVGDHTTVGLLPGDDLPDTIYHEVGDLPPGEYDGVVRVWDGRDPDTSRAPETKRVITDAFTIDNEPETEEPEQPEDDGPKTGDVTVRVVNQNGDPVEGVTAGIRLVETKKGPVGNDGEVTFTVPEESLSYTAYYINRGIVHGRQSVEVDADNPKEVTFEIEQTGTLRGTISIGDRPVTGEIELLGAETEVNDGVFEFDESVPAGRHSLKISPADSDKKTVYKSVTIEPGDNSVNWGLTEPFDEGAFLTGAVMGDRAYRQQETVSSEFMIGWMMSGTVPLADARDTLSSAAAGDKSETMLNLVGVVPLAGQSTLVKRMGQLRKKGSAKAIDNVVLFLQRSDYISDERVLKLMSELNYAKEFPRSTVSNYVSSGDKITRLKDAAKTAKFRVKYKTKRLSKITTPGILAELTTTRRLVDKYDATLINKVDEIDEPGYYVMHSVPDSASDYSRIGEADAMVINRRSNGEIKVERIYEVYHGNSKSKTFKKLSQVKRKARGVGEGAYEGLDQSNVPDDGIDTYYRIPDDAKQLQKRGTPIQQKAAQEGVELRPFDRTKKQFERDQEALETAVDEGNLESLSQASTGETISWVSLSPQSTRPKERVA